MNTLELLDIAAGIVPDREAIVSGEQAERRLTFAQLKDRAARLAGALEGLGVRAGDRVAIMDINSVGQIETYFACARLGAIFVPLNFRSRPAEVAWMLDYAGASVVLAGARYINVTNEATSQISREVCRIVIDGPPAPTGWAAYEELLASQPLERPPSGADDDPTMIMFTSGATSRPKGVVLTHASFCTYVLENVIPADVDPTSAERTILTVPLYHIAGVQSAMAAVYGGRTIVLQPQFEPEEWMRFAEQERVNRAMLVPTMIKALIEHPKFEDFDLSSLRVITYGAAAMPGEVLERAIEAFPKAQFINAFGQTESAATITMLGPEDHVLQGTPGEIARKKRRLRSIGKPLPDVEVRIVDEHENDVAAGATGEIVARGPRLMKGYWSRPDLTAEAFKGGWLHTGDLGYRDEDGYIFLQGRAREIIKRGGEMISPEEVEEILAAHPAVGEVAVIGVPDPDWGEVVHAVVALKQGAAASEAELIEFCRQRIASYKKPEKVHFVDALPRNQLGKVLRGELRERLDPRGRGL
ncbi:MAG: long-chain-fatty-acid--CoA ligase [Chloroflexi bacterium]|nr:long-chain-fatty-acid--CoA ligase [Chloroflexota bacterium]